MGITREIAIRLCIRAAENEIDGSFDFQPACTAEGVAIESAAADMARKALWEVPNYSGLGPKSWLIAARNLLA